MNSGRRARVAPPPEPADVALVAALPIEVAPFLDRLTSVRRYAGPRRTVVEGECAGTLVAVLVGGPGRPSALRAVRTLLDGHRPRWVISAGFGGALDPGLKINDVVFASEVLDREGGAFSIDLNLPSSAGEVGYRSGTLVTVDHIVRTAKEKAALRGETGADVVDMETAAVAAECSARGVRFLSIRVISDVSSTDLPPEIATIMGRTGSYRVGAALGAIWRRPSSLNDLLALRAVATSAADRLDGVLAGAIAQLPP